MKVVFLGVGEAFDENLTNTSIWVRSKASGVAGSVLLDCGFTAPSAYWRQGVDREELDAVWISHFHGDHFFGLPALLLKFWEMKRVKPLLIVGQTRVEEVVRQAMDLAYPHFMNKLGFPLEFVPVNVNQTIDCAGFTWSFAENGHGQRDLALRLDDGKRSLFYSGGRSADGGNSFPGPRMHPDRPRGLRTGRAHRGGTAPSSGVWNSPGKPALRSWPWCTCSGTND